MKENPKSLHMSCLNFELWQVPLVGYAMFATVAGASVTVGGTNTASPQRTRFFEVHKLARTASVWVNTPLKIHAHHSLVVVTDTDVG